MLDFGEYLKARDGIMDSGVLVYMRPLAGRLNAQACMYDLNGDKSHLEIARRLFRALYDSPDRGLPRDVAAHTSHSYWSRQRGFIAGGSGMGRARKAADGKQIPWAKMMFTTQVMQGVYALYLALGEENPDDPDRELMLDMLEGGGYFEEEATFEINRPDGGWIYSGQYCYNLMDATIENQGYSWKDWWTDLVCQWPRVAAYVELGGESWMRPHFEKSVRYSQLMPLGKPTGLRVRALDGRGTGNAFPAILYYLLHPKKDQNPPTKTTDLAARAAGSGQVTLTWTAPQDAVRYQVKYSPKMMVQNLNYDKYTRKFEFDPARYANWWAAKNVVGEPEPAAAGKKETFMVSGLAPGTYYFGIRSWDDASNRSQISNQVKIEVK